MEGREGVIHYAGVGGGMTGQSRREGGEKTREKKEKAVDWMVASSFLSELASSSALSRDFGKKEHRMKRQ